MKKIILAISLAAFTLGSFAGEACCSKAKAACAGKDKAACAEKAAAGCPMKKGQCPDTAKAQGKKVQSPKDSGKS